MKIGIIGFGSIGERHYKNLQKHGADVVVLTKRTDVADINAVGVWEAFGDKGPYDAIFITNETAKHAETIRKCLALNLKGLFIEKPISHTADELDELAAKMQEKKISVWVGYNLHFFAPFVRIKEILEKSTLGRLYYLRVSVGQDLSEWRARDYAKGYSSKRSEGGGVMLDLVHDINYPAWLLNEPLHAEAGVVKKISDLAIDTEDIAECIFSTASGVLVSVHQDYLRVPYNRSLEIAGADGVLKWDSDDNTIRVFRKDGRVSVEEHFDVERNEMYESEVSFFIDSIKKGEYISNMDEAIHDVGLIEQIKTYAKQ